MNRVEVAALRWDGDDLIVTHLDGTEVRLVGASITDFHMQSDGVRSMHVEWAESSEPGAVVYGSTLYDGQRKGDG